MDEIKRWEDQVTNDKNLIDGLDECELVDDKEIDEEDGNIYREYIKQTGDELNVKEQVDIKADEYTDENQQNMGNNVDEDDYKYIIKPENIVSETQEELTEEQIKNREKMSQQRQWESEMTLGSELDNFPIEKHKDEEKVDEDSKAGESIIENETVKDEYPTDINKIPLEVAVDKEDIEIVKPKDFSELVDTKGEILENYISGKSKFSNTSENLGACIELCKLFASVHEMNCCFNGITANDIVITKNKKCKLVNTNKIVSGDDDTYKVNYEKTCAPEVIRNESRPSIDTDKHSMAFLLFGLLFKSNPFEGGKVLNTPCYSEEDELKYYADPVFVYNSEDKSNSPVYGVHSVLIKYWNRFYPDFIKMFFNQMFVVGITSPEARTEEKLWIEKLIQFKTAVNSKNTTKEPAPNKKENEKKESLLERIKHKQKQEIIDGNNFETKEKTIIINKDEPQKPVDESLPKYRLYASYSYTGNTLVRESYYIKLAPGVEIKNDFVGYEDLKSQGDIIGKVVENSKHKGVLGIKNMSNHEWIATKGDATKRIMPGKVLVVSDKVEIDFYTENKSQSKTKWYIQKV
ncbi:hypothetical protein [Intestinibacter sp.]